MLAQIADKIFDTDPSNIYPLFDHKFSSIASQIRDMSRPSKELSVEAS